MSDQEGAGNAPRNGVVDGPLLRAARQSQRVTLRQVAAVARHTHHHLSKVERGEYGRPVTPAIIAGYERALGISLTEVAAGGEIQPGPGKATRLTPWRSGQMNLSQRRELMGRLATIAVAGEVAESARHSSRLLGDSGQPAPAEPSDGQMDTLENLVEVLDQLGEPTGAVAHHLLFWAVKLLTLLDNAPHDAAMRARVHAVISRLARRAGREAEDAGRHEPARTLYLLALHAVVAAGDPDLRAGALADLAQHHITVGYPDDALATLRLAEGDERIHEETRARLKTVRAEAEQGASDGDLHRQ